MVISYIKFLRGLRLLVRIIYSFVVLLLLYCWFVYVDIVLEGIDFCYTQYKLTHQHITYIYQQRAHPTLTLWQLKISNHKCGAYNSTRR